VSSYRFDVQHPNENKTKKSIHILPKLVHAIISLPKATEKYPTTPMKKDSVMKSEKEGEIAIKKQRKIKACLGL